MIHQKRFQSLLWVLFCLVSLFYFSACQCDADALVDNNWVLEKYGPEDNLTDVIAASNLPGSGVITINFTVDNKVNGSDGCNTYLGTYSQDKCNVSVANLQTTLILCTDQDVMTQATAYTQILEDVRTFRTSNNRLCLCTDDGRELHYRKE